MGSFFKSLGAGILSIFGGTIKETGDLLKQTGQDLIKTNKEIIKEVGSDIPSLVDYLQDGLNDFKDSQQGEEDMDALLLVLQIITIARGK